MFIKDWKRVLSIGYSSWSYVIIGACFIVPYLLSKIGIVTNPFAWAMIGLTFTVLGYFGRTLEQGENGKIVRRVLVGIILVLSSGYLFKANAHESCNVNTPQYEQDFAQQAFTLIARWEGKRNHAYLDVVGVPTICFGETKGVRLGDYKTDAECDAMLRHEIIEYRDGFRSHLKRYTIQNYLHSKREAAFTSLTYNIGVRAVGRSTAVRRLNRGDIKGSCDAAQWYNKAGGVKWTGLVNRRNAEYELCMAGV